MADQRICGEHKAFCTIMKEVREDMDNLKTNVYGVGPEGAGGVYGELKRKVGFRTLLIILSMLGSMIAFAAGFGINHESRLTKVEVVVERNTRIINQLCIDISEMRKVQNDAADRIINALISMEKRLGDNKSLTEGK